jgi:hypothetical protein
MNKYQLISYALTTLNDRKNGETLFEILCGELIPKKIDPSFLSSSGLAAGGDGGIDGIGSKEAKSIKYAFSINKQWKVKLKNEVDKTDFGRFSIIRFFTNQIVPERIKSKQDENRIAIEIYDLENLIDIISQDESLGRIIGVPTIANSVTIEYLNRNNQFQDQSYEIGNYLPRKVSGIDPSSNDRINFKLADYCFDLPKFTVLESRAGYGKTCLLKSLHQMILRQEIDLPLPTGFLRLRDYSPGNLKNMIDTGMSMSGDYQVNDVLLILDGFDEVPDSLRINLLKEINQFVNNTPYIRKVILSVRENEYDSYEFQKAGWEDLKTIRLEGLDNQDIQYILENSNLPQENHDLLLSNELFQSFCDNIFYVVSIIEFYETRSNLAPGMVELFEFLVNKEVKLLFRDPKDTEKLENELENIALFMTLHQIHKISINRMQLFEELNYNKEFFEFSHKNIQEYLAARKIAKQHIDKIKGIIAKGDRIISTMTNSIGFLLNLLNSQHTSYAKFEELVEWSLPGMGNARKLLQIEPDKITPKINRLIFRSVLEQEAKIGNVWEIPSNIINFCTNGGSKNENIQFLVDQSIAKIDTNEFFYFSIILQMLLNQELIELEEYQEKQIKLLFKSLLDRENSKETQERIEYLLSVVTKFHRRFMDREEYILVKEKLSSYYESDSIFDKFCKLVIESEIKLSIHEYLDLLEYIFSSRISEGHQMAGIVPRQITDSNYKLNMIHVKYWESFLYLTETILLEKTDYLLKVLEFLKENYDENLTSRGSNRELKEYLRHAFNNYDFNSLLYETEIVVFIKNWISEWANLYIIHPLIEIVLERNQKNILFRLIKETIVKETKNEFGMSVFDELLMNAIYTKEDFDLFFDSFYEDNQTSIKNRYKSIIHLLEPKSDLYLYAKTKSSNLILQEIEEDKKNINLFEQRKNERLSKPKRDYKIAFSFDKVKREINKIFQVLGKESFQRLELFNLRNLDTINEFALYILRISTDKDEELIESKRAILTLEKLEWDLSYVHFLLQYFYSHSIDINSLDSFEKNNLIDWMKLVLNKYPLDNIDNAFKNAHITFSNILRKINDNWISLDFKKEYGIKCKGLVFSGFPKHYMGGIVFVDYDSYSLDYLDKVIDPIKIINFINENFDKATNHSRVMIGISGYLSNHKDQLIPGVYHELKKKYIDYLENHLKEDYYTAVLECAYDIGISLLNIEKQLISDSLQINEARDGLKHNYAGAFYMYESKKYSESDPVIQHLCDAILDAILKSEDVFAKKTFAEYFLEMNKSGGEVFQWYLDYLMKSDENPISSRLVRMSGGDKIYSRNLDDLAKVEQLFIYSRKDNIGSDRRRSILEFAIASYKAMGESAESIDELHKVLDSIEAMVESGHEFMHRVKSNIESSFYERNYTTLSLPEIQEMV